MEEVDAVDDLDAERVLALGDVVSNVDVDDLVDVDRSTQLHVGFVAVVAETKRSENEITFLPLSNLAFVAHLVDIALQHHIILIDRDGWKRRYSCRHRQDNRCRRSCSCSGSEFRVIIHVGEDGTVLLGVHALDAVVLDDALESSRSRAAHGLWTL